MVMAFFTPFAGSHETPVGRCAKALALGALTGTGLTATPALLAPIMLLYVLPVAFLCWLCGLFFVGAPIWALLHLAGVRQRWAAILLGLLAAPTSLIVWVRMTNGWQDPPGLQGIIVPAAFLLALPGAIAANVVWRKAYLGAVFGNRPKEKGGTVSDPALPIQSAGDRTS